MKLPQQRHVFGPVPSRRLGRSLGVDPVPFKTCCYDCVYCQLGRTTDLTTERRPYVPAATLIDELAAWLARGGHADYITLSGSGEPTLNSEVGEVIAWARAHAHTPVAVLTNGALLWREEVRRDVSCADVLIPSLDAAAGDVYRQVNRPAPGVDLEQVVEGLVAARLECRGQMWLEVMLVAGLNDTPEHLRALRRASDHVRPDRVHLNTVVRPPAEPGVMPLAAADMAGAQRVLGPRAELIAPRTEHPAEHQEANRADDLMALLRRRPCTLEDVAVALGVHRAEAAKCLAPLLQDATVRTIRTLGTTYYAATAPPGHDAPS